ncbi:receptor-like protein kinase [Pyrus ussuriensis x Pyrus communis]|uniref:Receptor-like protein kinase n=1 Tax=Pyrus ussuriensis x Pyrus communis TaxID=2448454 RepID=A0A5N5GP32_9ROSA|nr:receptor-like protein kinase [Pyrus ussuriensis x Pyrus communis]
MIWLHPSSILYQLRFAITLNHNLLRYIKKVLLAPSFSWSAFVGSVANGFPTSFFDFFYLVAAIGEGFFDE